jgi:hypothetical protein
LSQCQFVYPLPFPLQNLSRCLFLYPLQTQLKHLSQCLFSLHKSHLNICPTTSPISYWQFCMHMKRFSGNLYTIYHVPYILHGGSVEGCPVNNCDTFNEMSGRAVFITHPKNTTSGEQNPFPFSGKDGKRLFYWDNLN